MLNHPPFPPSAASRQRATARPPSMLTRHLRRAASVLAFAVLTASLILLSIPSGIASAASLTTCTPLATLPANVSDPNEAFDTVAHVIATFNTARQQEGCTVSLSIDPTAYAAATPQMQVLMLLNAERQDRGLGTLQLDSTLLSQIVQNHDKEMVQYNYFAHPSPINQLGAASPPTARDMANPAVNGHNTLCCGENLAAGSSNVPGGGSAADSVYRFMYQDSASNWGHRQNVLGYCCGSSPTFGHYTWVGIGVATGGQYGVYYGIDFLEDSSTTPYTPPSNTDTQPPSMNAPTIVSSNTVQVTGVQDNSDGGASGAAGVTGVVFYVGSAVASNGTFQTVAATQTSPGTWTATLSASDPTTLHAVAVDGSGNYKDCTASGGSCPSGTPAPTELPLRRYFNYSSFTHWITTGQVTSSYQYERTLGSLLSTAQSGTQAIYGCVATGTQDHFLSSDSTCGGQTVLMQEGYIYTSQPAGIATIQLYRCHLQRSTGRDDYVSADPNCEGYTNDGTLGFALATALQRYFSYSSFTHWITTGAVTSSYQYERTLGSLLSTSQVNTQLLYGCVTTGTQDHFLSSDSACNGQTVLMQEGYIYTSQPAGVATVQLYRCHLLRPTGRDDYVSADPNCEGYTTDGTLGFALAAG